MLLLTWHSPLLSCHKPVILEDSLDLARGQVLWSGIVLNLSLIREHSKEETSRMNLAVIPKHLVDGL